MSFGGEMQQENKSVTNTKSEIKNAKSLISARCLELLQFRNHEEEKSARLYEDMYMYLKNIGFTNFGNLWHKYAHEELVHADWAREYLLSLGIQPELRPMPLLKGEYTSLVDIIEKSYQHEIDITEQCKALGKAALEDGDILLYQLAVKYLNEQIEEIDKMQTWMDKLNTFGKDIASLHRLELELAE